MGRHVSKETLISLPFFLPSVVFILCLYLFPAIITFIASFRRGDIGPNLFNVFDISSMSLFNYVRSLRDSIWIKSIYQTFIFAGIVVGFGILVALFIALVLNQEFRGRAILRVMILIPWVVPPIVNGTTWKLMFHANCGTLNAVLYQLGLINRYIVWLNDPTVALAIVSLAVTWRYIPFMTLFILAGLQTVSRELQESAKVDGANAFQRFRYVTLPILRPVLLNVVFMQTVWATRVFDEVWAIARGGPSYGTTVMNLWIYRQAFNFLDLGYGSALAYILALLTFGFLIVNHYMAVKTRE